MQHFLQRMTSPWCVLASVMLWPNLVFSQPSDIATESATVFVSDNPRMQVLKLHPSASYVSMSASGKRAVVWSAPNPIGPRANPAIIDKSWKESRQAWLIDVENMVVLSTGQLPFSADLKVRVTDSHFVVCPRRKPRNGSDFGPDIGLCVFDERFQQVAHQPEIYDFEIFADQEVYCSNPDGGDPFKDLPTDDGVVQRRSLPTLQKLDFVIPRIQGNGVEPSDKDRVPSAFVAPAPFGWYREGVIYDQSLSKPLLLITPGQASLSYQLNNHFHVNDGRTGTRSGSRPDFGDRRALGSIALPGAPLSLAVVSMYEEATETGRLSLGVYPHWKGGEPQIQDLLTTPGSRIGQARRYDQRLVIAGNSRRSLVVYDGHLIRNAVTLPAAIPVPVRFRLTDIPMILEGNAQSTISFEIEGGIPPYTVRNTQIQMPHISVSPRNSFLATEVDGNHCQISWNGPSAMTLHEEWTKRLSDREWKVLLAKLPTWEKQVLKLTDQSPVEQSFPMTVQLEVSDSQRQRAAHTVCFYIVPPEGYWNRHQADRNRIAEEEAARIALEKSAPERRQKAEEERIRKLTEEAVEKMKEEKERIELESAKERKDVSADFIFVIIFLLLFSVPGLAVSLRGAAAILHRINPHSPTAISISSALGISTLVNVIEFGAGAAIGAYSGGSLNSVLTWVAYAGIHSLALLTGIVIRSSLREQAIMLTLLTLGVQTALLIVAIPFAYLLMGSFG